LLAETVRSVEFLTIFAINNTLPNVYISSACHVYILLSCIESCIVVIVEEAGGRGPEDEHIYTKNPE